VAGHRRFRAIARLEKFYREETSVCKSTAPDGLAICKAIVEAHGGQSAFTANWGMVGFYFSLRRVMAE